MIYLIINNYANVFFKLKHVFLAVQWFLSVLMEKFRIKT
jgi:hypothetical protein